MNPTLCRFIAYSGPGLPRPTISHGAAGLVGRHVHPPQRRACPHAYGYEHTPAAAPDGNSGRRNGRQAGAVAQASAASSPSPSPAAASSACAARTCSTTVSSSTPSLVPYGQRDVLGQDGVAGRQTLDGDGDRLGDVRGLGLDRQRVQHVLEQVAARSQLALGVHVDLDVDLLAALHEQQVDVLEEALDRVTLHGLRDGQLLALPSMSSADQDVRRTQRQQQLVARQGEVDRVGTVTVDARREPCPRGGYGGRHPCRTRYGSRRRASPRT